MAGSNYPFIEAWGRYMGSHSVYIREEQERARQSGAPADAIYQVYPAIGAKTATWARASALPEGHNFRAQYAEVFEQFADKLLQEAGK